MNILLCSHKFDPSVGGIETVSRILAEEFTRAGASVRVVTQSPGDTTDTYSYDVVREPETKQLKELARRADVVFQNNISIKTLLPLLRLRKPIVVTTQTWIARNDGSLAWQDRLKQLLLRFVERVSISRSIAETIPASSLVIPNPFEMTLFAPLRSVPKSKDIVFLGRLVSDKGCDLVLDALSQLKTEELTPSLTVIGDGPEHAALQTMAARLGLSDQVTFLGNLAGERAAEVAQHKIMVIPSRWAEPFGVVALEGIATGCAIAASSKGGLPEAVGPCGLLFPNGDSPALAAVLKTLLTDTECRQKLVDAGPAHLERFAPARIASEYMRLFTRIIEKRVGARA